MRTMYSHKSGPAPVIDRETFERGVRLGDDYIAVFYDGSPATSMRPLSFYQDPCNFAQRSCNARSRDDNGVPAARSLPANALQGVTDQLRAITLELLALRSRLDKVEAAVASQGDAN